MKHPPVQPRVGVGFDVHPLVEGRRLILGGIEIDYHLGLDGHSDADVLTHAIMDALAGAIGICDIGTLFPDTEPVYQDADSVLLLKKIWDCARRQGYVLGNVDATVIAQEPKLAPHFAAMKKRYREVLGWKAPQVNLKATTTEHLGFTGRGEGMAAQAVVLLLSSES
jgi:2-C-methyl-D-erythritol 2,4-cyclodiphosphate synthase